MQAGSWVTRDMGSVATGRLQFAGLVNFRYVPWIDIITGFEMPYTPDTGVIDTLHVVGPTILHLEEEKTMNGVIIMDPGSMFNLDGNMLNLYANQPLVHLNSGDILNGLLNFSIFPPLVVELLDPFAALPDITVNSPNNTSGELLIVHTAGKVGILTANGTAGIAVENAGESMAPIGGVVNNGTGKIDLRKDGAISLAPNGDLKSFNGVITFSHINGFPGPDSLGNVLVDGGVVSFAVSDTAVVIRGNGDFFTGVWDISAQTSASRVLQLSGANYRF